MRYVEARIDKFKREEMYRIFISESLRIAPEGKHITKTWSDFVNQTQEKPVDAEEVINDVMLKAGLSFGRE